MERNIRKLTAVILAFIVTLTFMPAIQGNYAFAAKKPAKVTGTKGSLKANSIYFSWKKAKRATRYQVYQKKQNGKWKKKVTTKKRQVRIAKLKWNTKYYIKVRAVNGKKKGKFSKTWYGKIGKKETLQSVLGNQSFAEIEKENTTDELSTKVAVSGNTLCYNMQLKFNLTTADKAAYKKELAKTFKAKSVKKDMKGVIRDLEYETGLSGIKLKVTVKAKDGTLLFSYTYS